MVITLLFNVCLNDNENLVKYLVDSGADVNKQNNNGITPLFDACDKENNTIVKYLVEHGANVNITLVIVKHQYLTHMIKDMKI